MTASGASGYYLPRKQQNKPQSQQQSKQNQQSSSTSMLSLCTPVTMANTTTSDPAKAVAAATSILKSEVAQTKESCMLLSIVLQTLQVPVISYFLLASHSMFTIPQLQFMSNLQSQNS
ncbi:time for coffee-like protein isoform X1 [Tanacetum coccineum]